MEKRAFKQIAALTLAVLVASSAAALPAYAAGVEDDGSIVYEAMDQRDANTKVFSKKDGSFVSLISEAPVHYQKDGQWTEIDNTLEAVKTENGDAVLRNKSNPYGVELPQRIGADKPIVLRKDGYEVSFVMEDVRASAADVGKRKPVKGASEAEKRARLEKRSGTVTYENIQKNTDLEYIVTASRLTENIVLGRAPADAISYCFTLRTQGVDAAQQPDRSILFSNAAGEPVFLIPAPYMIDDAFARSGAVDSVLTANADGSWTLVYTPSIEWLQDEARQYPVKIDPDVQLYLGLHISADEDYPMDTYVDQSMPDKNFVKSDLLAISNVSGQEQKMYVDPLARILDFMKRNVLSATLRYHLAGSLRFTKDAQAGLFAITHIDDSSYLFPDIERITYNNQPTEKEIPLDTAGLTEEYLEFDITKVIRGLTNGMYLTNLDQKVLWFYDCDGFMIRVLDGAGREGTSWYDGQFTIYPEYAPTMEISYTIPTGLSGEYDRHQWDLGKNGVLTLNDFTQYISIDREEIGFSDARMPVQIRRYFDTGKASITFAEEFAMNSPYGAYWQTNYDRRLTYQDTLSMAFQIPDAGPSGKAVTPYYQYLDGDGTMYEFLPTGIVEDGFALWLPTRTPVSSQKALVLYVPQGLEDPTGYQEMILREAQETVLTFDSQGRMVQISAADDPAVKVQVRYDADREFDAIDRIIDSEGREYRFQYDYQKLQSISCYDAQGQPVETVNASGQTVPCRISYEYSGYNVLTKTIFPDGTIMTATASDQVREFPGTMQTPNDRVLWLSYTDMYRTDEVRLAREWETFEDLYIGTDLLRRFPGG